MELRYGPEINSDFGTWKTNEHLSPSPQQDNQIVIYAFNMDIKASAWDVCDCRSWMYRLWHVTIITLWLVCGGGESDLQEFCIAMVHLWTLAMEIELSILQLLCAPPGRDTYSTYVQSLHFALQFFLHKMFVVGRRKCRPYNSSRFIDRWDMQLCDYARLVLVILLSRGGWPHKRSTA